MRITQIQLDRVNKTRSNQSSVRKTNLSCEYSSQDKLPINNLANEIQFLGNRKTLSESRLNKKLQDSYTPEAEETIKKATAIAKKTNSPELELWHVYYAILVELKAYINELNSGEISYDSEGRYKTPIALGQLVSVNTEIFADKKSRDKILSVVEEHLKTIKKFTQDVKAKNPKVNIGKIKYSKSLINHLANEWDVLTNARQVNGFYDDYFFIAAYNSPDKKLLKEIDSFVLDLKKELMIDDSVKKQKGHLQFYDEKADSIWKNISLGNNVVILNDAKNAGSYKHLISSFVNLINKPNQQYSNISNDKLDIIVLNELVDFETLLSMSNEILLDKKNNDRTTVFVAQFENMHINSNGVVAMNLLKVLEDSLEHKKDAPNLKFVFVMQPENYYTNTKQGAALKTVMSNFAIQTLPTLNAHDAKKYLLQESGAKFIEDKIKKNFPSETIEKAVDLTNTMSGNYPDKALQLLSSASKYFVNEKELTPALLEQYIQETANLSEVSGKNEEVTTIFDTGKKLDDIVGSPMTKAQALSLVKQIQSGVFNTKGYCIYLSDGSALGGGRKHVAEAIAGEAQIPMVVINAKEFAIKDIDAVSQNTALLEMKIKKIISNAKAQAETNQNNTAMIFIENFDNFASNPLYGVSSIYEQKAFSQLLAEMESSRKNDKTNLLVMGSMNMPDLLDENIMKPYKFLNSIVVYQPRDPEQRKEVLEYYIDKMNLQIDGESIEDVEKAIKNISETTYGFSVVDLIYLLETAQAVSMENGRDKINSSDFTEAFLQTISGRANTAYVDDSEKKIVSSHEAGHALNLQIMCEIAKKSNIPWHLPDNVDFITLDPRGDFGGAMFHKSNKENRQTNFETVMSNIICSYGGHSAEKIIYNMPGSWGITADMENVSYSARRAVMDMGMGPETGVYHVIRNAYGQADVSEHKKMTIEKDIDSFTQAGNQISDMIVENYKDFILEFTEKYYSKVATGECLIPGEQFVQELNDWRNKQTPQKQAELLQLETSIAYMLDNVKKGNNKK